MHGHRSIALLIGIASLSSACRGPRPLEGAGPLSPQEAASAANAKGEPSSLGAGDLIEVRVFQEPDLSGAFRITPEGVLDYPLCGKVRVAGMTSSQAADALTHCLAQGYLKSPQVTVLIREYNSQKVFVFGEVQKPGTFPFDQNMSIVQAITLAGGFSKSASKNNTYVTRILNGEERKIRVPVEDIGVGRAKNFLLQPGDIVFVPESFF